MHPSVPQGPPTVSLGLAILPANQELSTLHSMQQLSRGRAVPNEKKASRSRQCLPADQPQGCSSLAYRGTKVQLGFMCAPSEVEASNLSAA